MLESWAEGVPIFTQALGTYRETDSSACFDNAETLDRMVERLFQMSPEEYLDLTDRNYRRLDDFWLENNISRWIPIIFRQK